MQDKVDLFQSVEEIIRQIEDAKADDTEALERFRIKYLGSKNIIKPLFAEMRNVANERKKDFGLILNKAKKTAEDKYEALKADMGDDVHPTAKAEGVDISLPPPRMEEGTRHPIALVMNEIIDIFSKIGFQIAEEREIEDDWHNFTAMNTPKDHPARDMQDTFYLKDRDDMLLRTHTSSVQARIMTSQEPPIRIIAPGRVYRNETISARSHCQFHQVEGLYVAENVSFADMKQTILYYAREMYGPEARIRLRPSYFPFTEPSAEVDVYWGLENEDDYRITKGTGWLEIMGCGMVDPAVLENCSIDPDKFSGYAFGMGIERQAMLKYNVTDIRMFFENDVRFLKQFYRAL